MPRISCEDTSPAKIDVTSKSPVGDIVVTLIRTDTTLDHSQKAGSFSDSHAPGAGASGPRGLGPAQLSWRGRRGRARLRAGCPGDYGDRHLDGVAVRGSGLVRFSMIYSPPAR